MPQQVAAWLPPAPGLGGAKGKVGESKGGAPGGCGGGGKKGEGRGGGKTGESKGRGTPGGRSGAGGKGEPAAAVAARPGEPAVAVFPGKGKGGPADDFGPGAPPGPLPRMAVPEGPNIPKSWEEHFPHCHYMEATWPVTKAKYPPRTEQRSWLKHEELAEMYACVVKLGGRQTQKRTKRPPGRLVVKGIHVEECFVALLRKSRRAFKGDALIEFTHRTVPPI